MNIEIGVPSQGQPKNNVGVSNVGRYVILELIFHTYLTLPKSTNT